MGIETLLLLGLLLDLILGLWGLSDRSLDQSSFLCGSQEGMMDEETRLHINRGRDHTRNYRSQWCQDELSLHK